MASLINKNHGFKYLDSYQMTLEELRRRHSVRTYSPQEIPADVRNHLKAEITDIRSHEAGLEFQIFFDDPDPLCGFSKSYGFFKGVRNYVACVVDNQYPDVLERAGYFAQQFVMYAQSLGISTCYVGATFSSKDVKATLRAGWELPFIVVFGYAEESKPRLIDRIIKGTTHRTTKEAVDFLSGSPDEKKRLLETLPWLHEGLEGLACAPSAYNKRPVVITGVDDTVEASVNAKNPRTLIDLGIGMYNFGVAAGGDWEFGNPARFFPFDFS